MSDGKDMEQPLVFGLDIGTRNVVGTVGYRTEDQFIVTAQYIMQHDTRAMLDGQIHDIGRVSGTIRKVKEQLENAKQEVVKPFPKEKELNQMMERLSELNALLNMDEQGSSEEPENSGKQSIHDKLNAIKQNGQQEHDHDKTAKGNDIDCS